MNYNCLNSSSLCRLCVDAEGTVDLWGCLESSAECDRVRLAVKNHLCIQVVEDDQICEGCLIQVQQWEEFFTKCQLAQQKLKKLLVPAKGFHETKNAADSSAEDEASAAASELLDVQQLSEAVIPLVLDGCVQNGISSEALLTMNQVIMVKHSACPELIIDDHEIVSLPDLTVCNPTLEEQPPKIVEKVKSRRTRKCKTTEADADEENNSSCGSSARVVKAILSFDQVEEQMGRSLLPEEADCVRSWLETKNNRQLFKFLFGSGDNRIWTCYLCQQKVHGRYTELRRHCYEEHYSKLMYNCELCPKKFSYIRLYKRHLEKHFNGNSNIEQDKTEVIAQPSGSFVCEVCGRVLKQKNCLMKHMLTHLPEERKNTHFCDVCGKGFSALGMLTSHKNRVHIEGRPYQCKTCGRAYKTQRSWKDHCEAHLGNRVFVCDVCDMKLSSRQCLKLHTLTHTGEKPFTCDVCGRSYHSKSRMLRHKRITHNPNPQFICDVCGKAFRSRTGIEGHKLEHTGEVPNVCPICGKAIRAKSNFYAHLKVHRKQASRQAAATLPTANDSNADAAQEKAVIDVVATTAKKRNRQTKTVKQVETNYSFDAAVTETVAGQLYEPHLLHSILEDQQPLQQQCIQEECLQHDIQQPMLSYASDRFQVDCENVTVYTSAGNGPQYTYLTASPCSSSES